MWQMLWRYNDHVEIQTASRDFSPFMTFWGWEKGKYSLWRWLIIIAISECIEVRRRGDYIKHVNMLNLLMHQNLLWRRKCNLSQLYKYSLPNIYIKTNPLLGVGALLYHNSIFSFFFFFKQDFNSISKNALKKSNYSNHSILGTFLKIIE